MKNLIHVFLAIMIANVGFSQSIYFKIKDTEKIAQTVDGKSIFSQGDISVILKNLTVSPVLKHPEKFHSKSANRLKKTYLIAIEKVSKRDRNSIITQLERLNSIEYAVLEEEPILLSCPSNDPSDAGWNISRHDITCVQEAHCITTGDPNIIIAARDNGFIANHPEHVGQVVHAESGAYNGECHGTQTSITSAGATDNGFGLSSSGYDCSLALYHWSGLVSDYEDMLLRGVRIAHNSYINGCSPNTAFQDIINLVSEQGLIVVGSAGNGAGAGCGGTNDNNPTYPSAYNNVISVSSVSSGLCGETTYNFWGDSFDPPLHHTHNNTVDLLAQGYAVVTGNCDLGGQSMSYGTSIAGPHVAGIIGLMLSVNPCLNHDDALSILQSTGQDVTNVCNNSSYYPNGAPPVPCAESAVIAAQSYVGPTLNISTNTTWDQRFVSGNVIVKSGTTLTIHGTVSMGTNNKIIVEKNADLIIDGGTITSCHTEWKGIVVEGDGASGSQTLAGRVKLMNGATLENARNAISMNPSHLGWPAVSDHWGGLVEADDATFKACRRAVEFMTYGTGFIEDQSYFTNCTFEDIETSAVTIWANNNVTFQECTFDDILGHGIHANDSEVIVNNQCSFTNTHTGVDIVTTYPIPYASKIGDVTLPPNNFNCDNYGVYAQAQGNINPLRIQNNNFASGLYGVHIEGIANYQITFNNMTNGYTGVVAISTGNTHTNHVTNNTIGNNSYGSHAVYDNSNLNYTDNCFNTSRFSDIYVSNGSIFVDQGSSSDANGNCFSKKGVPEIDNSQNSAIKLWLWNGPIFACEYPSVVANNPSYNVIIDNNAATNTSESCGSMFAQEPMSAKIACNGPFKSTKDVLDNIAALEAEITNVKNDKSLKESYKDYLIKTNERCLHGLQMSVLTAMLEPNDQKRINDDQRIQTAIEYSAELPLFEQKALSYGLMVNTGQLKRAKSFLDKLSTTSKEQDDFVLAQHINLAYLSDTYNYKLSSRNETLLYEIGQGTAPLDAYARSIYEVLTGRRINIEIPEPYNSVLPSTKQDIASETKYSVYPNPSNGNSITVALEGKNESSDLKITLMDLFGRVILNEQLQGQSYMIDTNELNNGTYFISITNQVGEIEYADKVIIAK